MILAEIAEIPFQHFALAGRQAKRLAQAAHERGWPVYIGQRDMDLIVGLSRSLY